MRIHSLRRYPVSGAARLDGSTTRHDAKALQGDTWTRRHQNMMTWTSEYTWVDGVPYKTFHLT